MVRIPLHPGLFGERERVLFEDGERGLAASAFRYDSGVCAVRLRNSQGELIVLPFQGQQIWRAHLRGRELTMRSPFDQPKPTQDLLSNFGAFLVHCGFTGMGAPGPEDTHPLHGELPNAIYTSATLEVGDDARGPYAGLDGAYQHAQLFGTNYIARPKLKFHANSALFNVRMQVDNLAATALPCMYLAHINFRPVDGARLEYSARYDAQHVRIRRTVPAHLNAPSGYREMLQRLSLDPIAHHHISAQGRYEPEVVFSIDYRADATGHAHTLQILPDGSADYVRHRPDQLPKAMRWISRTDQQDALAMIEPATAEADGYRAERSKGNVKLLAGHASWRCSIDMGALSADETRAVMGRM